MALLDNVKTMTIETAWTPPLVFDQPFSTKTGSGPSIMAIIKPKFTFDTSLGPAVSQAWGAPVPNHWPMVRVGLIMAGASAIIGAVALIARR